MLTSPSFRRIYSPPPGIRIKSENEKELKNETNYRLPRQPRASESDNEHPAQALWLGTQFASQQPKALP
jgi:hypothetical protein